ncbi:MAG: DUF4926 domain-containing protein [Planctomycetota bacterium]
MFFKKRKKPNFKEYDNFKLIKPIEGGDVPVNYIGVVLEVYVKPSIAYEVEFVDESGCNIGSQMTFTLTEEYMKPVNVPVD